GRAPEKLYAGFGLLLLEYADNLIEISGIFRKVASFGPHISIVEAVIGRAKQGEELESHVGLELCRIQLVGIPRPVEGATTELIATLPGKAVPVGDREAQMIFHALAQHDLIW